MKKAVSITNRGYHLLSVAILSLLSFYPIMMGLQMLTAYVRNGHINTTDYPKYIIPYTPIALALLLSVALLPLFVKFCKRFALPVVSIFGTGLFLLFETLFERITVFDSKTTTNVGEWQAYLCFVTPEAMRTQIVQTTLGNELMERYSPAFKVHFYLISILIVLAVLGVVYTFLKMIRDKNYDKKRPLIVQAVTVSMFIGLCIFACFTAFYRTGELTVSAVSGWLMSIFFVVFGLTAGVYSGGLLYFKKPAVSRFIPALIAIATTLVMYIGELVLMGGVLFKFGTGFLFEPLGACPFALIDILVIIASGIITYFILFLIRKKNPQTASGGEAIEAASSL